MSEVIAEARNGNGRRPVLADTAFELPLDRIDAAEDNPRRTVGDLSELKASIAALGLLHPLLVTQRGDRYLVVAGARRLAAARELGLSHVPALVRELTETERQEAMLVENLQRTDLAPLEEAASFKRLLELGQTQRQLVERVGRSQAHISKRVALLELPANVRKEVDSGGITIGDALELLKLREHPTRLGAAFSRRGQHHRGLAGAVEDQLDEIETAAAIAQAKAELNEAGTKVVEMRKTQWGDWGLPTGAIRLDSWAARQLNLTKANHKAEPCHAAVIDPRDGDVEYICTQQRRHTAPPETPADEKEARRQERERDKAAQIRAREKNIELGKLLEKKLAAPAIDAENMRLLAELLMLYCGTELAHGGVKYVDEASQTIIRRKDGAISRVAHAEGTASRGVLERRLAAATNPEQIMGVLLQALLAAKHADTKAVPQSQRYGDYVRGLGHRDYNDYGAVDVVSKPLAKIAARIGIKTKARRR